MPTTMDRPTQEHLDKRLDRVEASVKDLRSEMGSEIKDLRSEIRDFRTEVHTEIKDLRAEMGQDIKALAAESGARLDAIQRTMTQGVITLSAAFIAGFAALVGLIATQL
ncbi:MAG: hypothetical protein WD810_03175 [Solirubrobacterales bacterium]